MNTDKPLMIFNRLIHFCFISLASLLLFSCENKTEQFETELLTDYIPLQPGKYITYRVDSLVFSNFGRNTEIHTYQQKHVIDALVMDNQNRPSYRVFRYLRDSAGTQPWTANGSYFITVLNDQVELIEDNLRFIKMHMPMRDGFSWKGNRYLPDNPYHTLYSFSNDDYMLDWDFVYDGQSSPFSYQGNNYTDVFSINHVDEVELVDTFKVTASNTIQIPVNKTAAWIAGNGSATVTVTMPAPTNTASSIIRLYNYSNNPIKLNEILTPVGFSRNYEYKNGQWAFGNNGKDTLYTDVPYGLKNLCFEKYSKHTGLVFKKLEMWEYQPNPGGSGGPYKTGFGITMWMIDHN